ncbi:MAG: phage antirepressor N-terminal domain-containing protein [Daejeonella sp.]
MKKSIEKFLEFNGKSVSFLNVDGQWWVAIKPICEVLNVHYQNQLERIKEDKILKQLYGEHHIVAADGALRKMVCLPEKYIYGWLFSLRSESEELVAFKKECYEALFDHFHGGISGKMKMDKLRNTAEIESLNKKVAEKNNNDPDFIRMKKLESENIGIGKQISMYEKEMAKEQLDLFRQQLSDN